MDQLLWEYRQLSGDSSKQKHIQNAIEWIWLDIKSMRSDEKIHLDANKKCWLDHDMENYLQYLFFPSVDEASVPTWNDPERPCH
jgi:hypothetical protein